jgi:hypothetical protein
LYNEIKHNSNNKTKIYSLNSKLPVTVFWDFAQYILAETDKRFREVYFLHYQGGDPDDGSSKHL